MTAKTLHAVNATDGIIRSTARHIDAIDGRYDAMANKSIHAYMISVNGTEEQFFLRYVGHSTHIVNMTYILLLSVSTGITLSQITQCTKAERRLWYRLVAGDHPGPRVHAWRH